MADAVVVNLENGAVSEYIGMAGVNSAAHVNGVLYICDAAGIHVVDANDDNGLVIDAEIATGLSDMGTHFLKRIPDVWIGLRTTGAVDFVTLADELAERRYHVITRDTFLREVRMKLDRGVRSRFWQFILRNRAGSDLQLSSITIEPQVLTRRVR